jgi:repressor of nif and glnA expression
MAEDSSPPESDRHRRLVMMGYTSQPVCQIPVGLNKVGVILDGGLNPLADR